MLKNKTIAKRLKLIFLILSGLVAISGLAGILSVAYIGKAADVIFENEFPLVEEARKLKEEALLVIINIHSVQLQEKGAMQALHLGEMELKDQIEKLKLHIVDQEAVDDLRQVEIYYQQLLAVIADLESSEKETTASVGSLSEQEIETLKDNLLESIQQLVTHAKNKMAKAMHKADRAETITDMLLILLTLIAIILAVVLGKKVSDGITVPLNLLVSHADKLAEGDLEQLNELPVTPDEIGSVNNSFNRLTQSQSKMTEVAIEIAAGNLTAKVGLRSERDTLGIAFNGLIESQSKMTEVAIEIAAGNLTTKVDLRSDRDALGIAFRDMLTSLNQQIQTIVEGANTLASSVAEISASSAQLASSSAENATAISETTSTVEEVRQTTDLASKKAEQMADNAHSIRETSQLGREATNDTIGDVKKIEDQMNIIAETIIGLSQQSQSIGQIITSVDSISEQSNVLAVNASIEAAKAGEQGKGFSVVAQEVKLLAEQSKKATKQVREILNEIQKSTNSAIMTTEQGNKVVEKVTETAKDAGRAIDSLALSIDQTADVLTQISASSQQQRVGMDQINAAMENVSEASQQNASSAKQLEAAVHNLNRLGDELKAIVESYRLG